MGVVHLIFGGTLLLTFGMNLLTLPGSESAASFFDRVSESKPATVLKGVIGQFIPIQQTEHNQPKEEQTTTTTTTTTTPQPNAQEGGSATLPPPREFCYLQKNDSGIIKSVNMSRAEAGNDTYTDYEEICEEEEEINTRISAGALASLAG